MSLADDLRAAVRGEVSTAPADLDAASRDASLFRVEPSVVVSPLDAADLQALVKAVARAHEADPSVTLTARSAGTDMSGGPLTPSVVALMTPHFDKILSVADGEAVVQPGVYYRDFEKEAAKTGQLLPSYPASKDLCTVGGMVANDSGGEKTLRYGKTEDYVKRLKAVLADGSACMFEPLDAQGLAAKKALRTLEGDIYRRMDELLTKNAELIAKAKPRVSKNSAGYLLWNVKDERTGAFDLTQVLVGSQGTLGLVTEATFRLVRDLPRSRMLVIFLRDLKPLADLVQAVMRDDPPESFESYDDKTLGVALRFLPEVIAHMEGNAFKLAFQFLPEIGMVLTGGVPKLVLIAEFTAATADEALAKAKEAQRRVAPFGLRTRVTHSEAQAEKYWEVRRQSFNLLRHHVRGLRTAPFIDDLVVRPERLPDFLPRLNAILNGYKMIYTVAGHVGDGNFHIIPLVDAHDPKLKDVIRDLSAKVYALVKEFDGSITGEHNDGLIRTPFLEEMFGPDVVRLFAETKKTWDPTGLFNPGKKTGMTLDEALTHLDAPTA